MRVFILADYRPHLSRSVPDVTAKCEQYHIREYCQVRILARQEVGALMVRMLKAAGSSLVTVIVGAELSFAIEFVIGLAASAVLAANEDWRREQRTWSTAE